ncbi:chymotrypsin BI-like [Penaeus japonicus]|uniref:chymotrypsin BI-like n=1 Tax=Penaeus japonicus TaxID=27405 RepID=UPI001C717325|nr:chymotrypsin BI-like [Penaeus japonicus]
MFALVLLCCVAGIASLPALDSGDANQATNISWIPLPMLPVSGPPLAAPRIHNGQIAVPHAYPYQAALSCNGRLICGGSVISDVHVVTSAECVRRPRKCNVVLGAHNLKRKEPSQQIIAVAKTYIHPEFSKGKFLNDIGILKLKEKIEFNKYVQPVNLPKTSPKDWMFLTHTGWGRTGKDSGIESFSALQVMITKTLKDSRCKSYFPPKDDTVFCVYNGKESPCYSDCHPMCREVVNIFHFNKWIKNIMTTTSAANSLLPDVFIMLAGWRVTGAITVKGQESKMPEYSRHASPAPHAHHLPLLHPLMSRTMYSAVRYSTTYLLRVPQNFFLDNCAYCASWETV